MSFTLIPSYSPKAEASCQLVSYDSCRGISKKKPRKTIADPIRRRFAGMVTAVDEGSREEGRAV